MPHCDSLRRTYTIKTLSIRLEMYNVIVTKTPNEKYSRFLKEQYGFFLMSVFNRRQRKAVEMLQIKGGKRDMKA